MAPHPLEISCAEVHSKLTSGDEFVFVDCRETDEHQLVNIAQAQLIPMSEIQDRLEELQPHQDSEVIIHCHHGGRSLQVANWLVGQGFSNAKSMAGGIDQWASEIDTSLPRY